MGEVVVACKVCGERAPAVGVVDFSRCGADIQAGLDAFVAQGKELNSNVLDTLCITTKVDDYAGEPCYYYRCQQCGFTFTNFCDSWLPADFFARIYNDDYPRHDPGFGGGRASGWAECFAEWFERWRHSATILDHGSGEGHFEGALTNQGFRNVASWDPFTQDILLGGRFDILFANEVFEHVVDPEVLFKELDSLCNDKGMVLFTTLMCSEELISNGIANWWYCAPSNGHISFFTRPSLSLLALRFNFIYSQLGPQFHMLARVPANDTVASIRARFADAIAYYAAQEA